MCEPPQARPVEPATAIPPVGVAGVVAWVVEFVPSDQVDLLTLDKAYYLEPDSSSPKAYVLLRKTLEQTDRVKAEAVPVAAGWPENLETWQRYYREHPRP